MTGPELRRERLLSWLGETEASHHQVSAVRRALLRVLQGGFHTR